MWGEGGLINFGCDNLRVMMLPKHSLRVGTHTHASKQGCGTMTTGRIDNVRQYIHSRGHCDRHDAVISRLPRQSSLSLDFGCVWMECFDTTLSLSLRLAFTPASLSWEWCIIGLLDYQRRKQSHTHTKTELNRLFTFYFFRCTAYSTHFPFRYSSFLLALNIIKLNH